MPKPPLSCCFLLFDGFSNMVLASALEPLRAAANLPEGLDVSWHIATLDNEPVHSSSRLRISPDTLLKDVPQVEYLFLVSGYGVRDHVIQHSLAALHAATAKARVIGAMDTGAWILAAADMLNGYDATIHWQEQAAFEEEFPRVQHSTQRFCVSGNRVTCGGASTAMDLVLEILAETFGKHVAFDISNLFVYDAERQSHSGRGASRLRSPDSDPLEAAVAAMADAIEHRLALPEIASRAATSVRSLNRLFYRELGMSPGKYYQMIRLNRARDLAEETDISLTEIAIKTGFSSPSTISRAFQDCFNQSIGAIRKRRRSTGR